jgi:transposase
MLASDHDNEYMMIDATIVRANQHSAGARKENGPQAIGRSRGGLTTKIHALVDALGNPVELILTPGQAHDLACAEPLIANSAPDALIADKAYDADTLIDTFTDRGIAPVIPRPRPTARPSGNATSRFTENATLSSASSINSSTSVPSQRDTTSSPEIFSPEFSSRPL